MKTKSSSAKLLLRLTAAFLLVAGTLSGIASSVSAQSDDPGLISDTEYESPFFDFTLSWDGPWIVTDGSVTSDGESIDQISLESDNGFLQIVIVTGSGLQDTLDILTESTADAGEDYEELGTDSGSDYLSATTSFSVQTDSGQLDLYKYIEVGEIETQGGDPAIFTGSLLAPVDTFEDEWANLEDGVDRDGRSPLFSGEPVLEGGSTNSGSNSNSTKEPEPGVTGNSYSSGLYGYSVEWDDSLWEAEDTGSADEDALILSSDNAQLQLRSYNEPDANERSCVTENAKDIGASEGIENWVRTTDFETPEAPEDGYSRAYTFDFISDEANTATFVQYIECRPLPEEGFVLISLLALDSQFEDELGSYADVIASLNLEGGTPGGGDIGSKIGKQGGEETSTKFTPGDPELKGATYTGGAYNFSVTWDDSIWTPEAMEPAAGYEGVKLTSDISSAWVEAIEGYGGDLDVCVTDTGDQLNDFDGVTDVAKERRPTLPETGEDAVAAIYSYTYTSNGDSLDFVEYIDCRVLVADEVVLRMTVIATLDGYEDAVPEWEGVLAGIEIGSSGSSGGSSGSNTNTNSGTTSSEELPGVDGRTYTSPQFPFSLTWDRTWEATSATADDSGTTLTLVNDVSTAVILVGEFPLDPADCVDAFAGIAGDASGVTNFQIVSNENGEPQSGGDNKSAYALYSFTQGGDDYFDYLYCQPAPGGDYVVAIAYQMPVASLGTEITVLEELLANFELG